jgi:hypothetical protein
MRATLANCQRAKCKKRKLFYFRPKIAKLTPWPQFHLTKAMHGKHDAAMTLAEYMKLTGVSDVKAAAALGVHQTTAMRVRAGKAWPSPELITKITEWSSGAVTADDLHAAYVGKKKG